MATPLKRLKAERAPNQGTLDPTWSPGDSLLVYRTAYAGDITLRLYHVATDLSDSLYATGRRAPMHFAWSPDGRTIGLTVRSDQVGTYEEAWMYSLGDRRVWKPFEAAGNLQWASWSPNGRWLAYQSDESGATEIYLRSASGHSAPIPVSTAGGECPRWRQDGRSLFYRAPDGSIMEVAVTAGRTIELSRPTIAVVGAPFASTNRAFAVLDNGQHFLAFARGDAPVLTISLDWQQKFSP